jgi:hypothetical protein
MVSPVIIVAQYIVGACEANVKFSGRQMEQSHTSGWNRSYCVGTAVNGHESKYGSSSRITYTIIVAIRLPD